MQSDMPFTTDQRKAALRAFVSRIESAGFSVAAWEKKAGLGEGTLRNFYKRENGTMTDRTYTKLAQAASEILGEKIIATDIQGTKVTDPADQLSVKDRPTLPPLLIYRSAPGVAQGGNTLVFMEKSVGEVERYSKFEFAHNAFCTQATDDLMAPLAWARDTLIIDPDKIPRKGDDCLFVRDPDANPRDTVFRHLVEIGASSWIVCAHSGDKTPYSLSFADYPKAWPMVSVIKA